MESTSTESDGKKPAKSTISKKQLIILSVMAVGLVLSFVILSAASDSEPDPGSSPTPAAGQAEIEEAEPEGKSSDAAAGATNAEEGELGNDMIVAAPHNAGWVLRLPELRDCKGMMRQAPLQYLLKEPRFPFSTAALNSAFYASKFDPMITLEGFDEIIDGPVTVVGLRRLNRWQGYAYAKVRESAWDLWKRQVLMDQSRGWRVTDGEIYVHDLNLTLSSGEIQDPMLIHSNGRVICLAIGEQAMDEFLSIWSNPETALRVVRTEYDPQTVQFYLSSEATRSGQETLFEAFFPALVEKHPLLRSPAHEAPSADVEGSISFRNDETQLQLEFRPSGKAPAGALTLRNASSLEIPSGVPSDALTFFRMRANLPEVMMGIVERNREDRSYAERAYTRFYTKRQYYPMEALPTLLGEDAYQFQVPSRRSGSRLATVWVWSVADGPKAAESLCAVLMAEKSGTLEVGVKRQGDLSLFEIPIGDEKWFMLGIDNRVFFTDEIEAIMARSRVDSLVATMEIPESLLRDQSMVFYRNQEKIPRVLATPPLDLSSFESIWWYIARAYPYQFGRIHQDDEGNYRAETWMRFPKR